jgi:trehalose-6-phosphate synthase
MLSSTIWPLFHYLPGDIDFNSDQWLGYVRANELFADRIAGLVDDGDCVWVHDYHLMLLPKMLREKCNKNISIGFFLHIPFPASDVYR